MQLSSQSAQRIVAEIGGIVRQHINLMDEQGDIIASTDPARIGQHHKGASRIIQEGLAELYVTPDQATALVRTGLNLPIQHEGKIVGVIGITGIYEQVVGYGQVVKKMTEILLRESTEQDEKRLDMRVHSRFLEDWVLSDGLRTPQILAERGLALGIDIQLPRRVMVVSVQELEKYVGTAEGQKLLEEIEITVSDALAPENGSIILRNAARQILLLRSRPGPQLQTLAENLRRLVRQRFGVYLAVGIDGGAADVHRAYAQANKAWRAARMQPGGVLAYDRVTLELFVGDIAKSSKTEYLHKVFPGCDYDQLRGWMGVLEAYFAADGSIAQAADLLYIHKNTLQYKLKKLEALTGYDVRLPSHGPVFYMALLFYKEVEGRLLL